MDQSTIFSSEMFEDAKNYWLDKLSGELSELDLPGDYQGTHQYVEASKQLLFGRQVTERLAHISKKNDLSLYAILLTTFKILLYKFADQKDIIVSASTLAKSSQSYNKCIALRDVLIEENTFKDFLLAVKNTVVDGYKNQYYPIRKLIKLLDIENLSLFKVVLLLDSIHNKEFVKETLNGFENDIIFFIKKREAANEGDWELESEITYNSKLFKEETILRMAHGYLHLLTQVLDNIDIKISDIEIITEEEKKQVLFDFNNTKTDYPKEKTIPELFREQVNKKPDNIAAVYENTSLTYEELDERANQLALRLSAGGVRNEAIVGLMVNPSLEMIAAILGIFKTGGAYLLIDPDYPIKRIRYMLVDSNTKILLATVTEGDRESEVNKVKELREEGKVSEKFEVIELGKIFKEVEYIPIFPIPLTRPDNLAYIIYTSGSTGKPKGVMVEHKNVVRLVKNSNIIDFKEGDRLLLTGAIGFDITTFEIWGPLLNSSTLFLAPQDVILDAKKLEKAVSKCEISILHLIPQLFNRWAVQCMDIFAGLKYLLVGGDIVKPAVVNQVRNKYKNLKILHMYGPTENTTFSTFFLVDKDYEIKIPIGKPINNSTVYILDQYNNLKPPGAVGELGVGGEGVARGYLNNPTLTRETFRKNPFMPDGRIYMTGDLSKWLPDGNIEFLGRRDHQVKIGGIRIELGEIENQLLSHEEINEAIVIAAKDEERDQHYLCAYIVADSELNVSQLREYLSRQLPDSMIPSFFVQVDKIPLTTNGKVDKKALMELKGKRLKTDLIFVEPEEENEKLMAELCKEVFNVDKIGINDNFFDLGANSFTIIQLSSKVQEVFQRDISVLKLFEFPTIASFLRYLALEHQGANINIETSAEDDGEESRERGKRTFQQIRNKRTEGI
jgi:tyrocidine synthetase-3